MNNTISLKEKWDAMKSENPHLRIRNAASTLGVSEVELLATQCGDSVTRLTSNVRDILSKIETLGYVMALTRNDDCVHERKGVYLNPELDNPHVGLFVGADIDLRIFPTAWASAFAVTEMAKNEPRYSLQFFGKDGEAVHKIYLTSKSNVEAYHALVTEFTNENQETTETVTPFVDNSMELADSEIDKAGFQQEWLNLKDTHDFFPMLRKYKVNRTQALRLAPEGNYAVAVPNDTLRNIFTKVAELQIPIMVFVGNKGMIQIHTGTVTKLVDHDEWFNVLDPEFNMHLKEKSIVKSWIVRKPTVDGMVTALECFDEKGNQIVQIFGKRKPGIPELEEWREVVKNFG